jgi:transcriptional regulator with XRE-family HTH domain
MAKIMGVGQSTYSGYEAGKSEPGYSEIRNLISELALGTEEVFAVPVSTEEIRFMEPSERYVTGTLPEHVQEAYKIVREALDIAKADISTMDQDQVGLVIGLAAEEIARGNRAEARQTLLRRAEVLLGLKAS